MFRYLRQAVLKSDLFILAPFTWLYVCYGGFGFVRLKRAASLHQKPIRLHERNYLIAFACFLIPIVVTLCVSIFSRWVDLSVGCDLRNRTTAKCLSSSFLLDKVCPHGMLYLLIVVHSAAGNRQRRQAVRDTWAEVSSYKGVSLRHVFVIGQTTDRNLSTELEREQSKFDDILRGDFVDTYHNLTRKMVSWMQWVDKYCPDVQFVMKCDDDVVIVPETTVDFIQDQMKPAEPVLIGNYASNLKPHRDPRSKWLITREQWRPPYLFQFHQGYAMLMAKQTLDMLNTAIREETVEKLYNATWTNFPVDDAFMGILANVSGVKLLESPSFINVFKLGKEDGCDICDKVV